MEGEPKVSKKIPIGGMMLMWVEDHLRLRDRVQQEMVTGKRLRPDQAYQQLIPEQIQHLGRLWEHSINA
jgi:hypothetical protein